MSPTSRVLLFFTLCATLGTATNAHAGLDGYNKGMLAFNRWLLRNAIEPVSRGYNFVMPKWGQRRVANVFVNLKAPRDLANSILQFKGRRAATHTGRAVVNTTLGLGGMFDVAYDWFGWDAPPETFSETLGVWGVPLGPYLILPVINDSSPRHGIGMFIDGFADPVAWFAPVFFYSAGNYVLRSINLLATQMPPRGASQAEWDAYRRSRFDFPRYEIGRENFIADEADRVAD